MALALFIPCSSSCSPCCSLDASSNAWRGSTSGVSSTSRVRASASDDAPLRRPAAPAVQPAPSPPSPPSSTPEPAAPPAASSPSPSPSSSSTSGGIVTVEFQRQRAKALQEYFLDKKYEEQAKQGQIFGWTRKNEVGNGRWAMFGIAVGLLTEYATGASFIEQLKIIVSNLGIADLE